MPESHELEWEASVASWREAGLDRVARLGQSVQDAVRGNIHNLESFVSSSKGWRRTRGCGKRGATGQHRKRGLECAKVLKENVLLPAVQTEVPAAEIEDV